MLQARLLLKLYASYLLVIVVVALVMAGFGASGVVGALGAIAAGAGVAMLVAWLLALALTRRVTRPLREMTAAAQALAVGKTSQRLAADDPADELGALIHAWNAMLRSLGEQLDAAKLERGRLAAILGSMIEGVVAVDPQERVVHINQVAADLLGVAPDSVEGRAIWEVTRIHTITEVLRAAMRGDTPAQRELRLAGSEDRVIELRATPLGTGSSGRHGAVLVLGDVTTMRRLETVRQDFVGNVSHELKTPVTAIRGLAETLLDDADMPAATRQRFLARLRDQSLRLSRLVVDLLSLSRLDGDAGGRAGGLVDVRQVVRAALRALEPASQAKTIRILATVPEAPVHVLGELQALEEALFNLLENAVTYSPEGAEVSVLVSSDEDEVAIAVIDRGIGIERRHLDRIFERFYRVDKARSRALGGTGLGLAIVKHIVRSLGGDITVSSEPGAGSCFTLHLPRQPGEKPAAYRIPLAGDPKNGSSRR